MNEFIQKLKTKKMKRDVIGHANRLINVPFLSEATEGVILSVLYDALVWGLEQVFPDPGPDEVSEAGE